MRRTLRVGRGSGQGHCQQAFIHGRLAPIQCGVTQPRPTNRRPAPPGPPQPYLVGPLNPLHIWEVDLGNRSSEGKLDSAPAHPWRPSRAPRGSRSHPTCTSALPPRPHSAPAGHQLGDSASPAPWHTVRWDRRQATRPHQRVPGGLHVGGSGQTARPPPPTAALRLEGRGWNPLVCLRK